MSERYAEYDHFAWFYNRYWNDQFLPRLLPIVGERLLAHLPAGATILDLCCGTGQLAAELTNRGYRMTGVDGSAEMLRYACEHAPQAEFVLADAREFVRPGAFQAAISAFDSLNHVMSLDELARVFANVAASLMPGGRFLFDLNLAAGYEAHWKGCSATVEDDHVLVQRTSYDPAERVGKVSLTLFRKEGEWRRHDLTLAQRAYEEEDVRQALAHAGFDGIDTFGMPDREGRVGRLFFLAVAGDAEACERLEGV